MVKLNELKLLQDSLEVKSPKEQINEAKAIQDFRVKKLTVKLKSLQAELDSQTSRLRSVEAELGQTHSQLRQTDEKCLEL